MEMMTFDGLEIELFSQEVVWQDFLDALAAFYQSQVREPLDGLREIRNISASTDPNVVLLTLRDLGIDIPLDLVVNPERLIKSVYMIPLIYQHMGRESAWRVIEFILGRRVSVSSLWTEDYVDFYTEPYGPLRVDGGTWYKTTHVNLSIQTVASDATITLPRNQTLKDRLLSAFYSFAPVNMVVDKFIFTVDTDPTEAGFCGVVQKHPKRIFRFGEDVPAERAFSIVGPANIEMGGSTYFYLEEAGRQYYTHEWWSDKPGLVEFDNIGKATFFNVPIDTDVTIYARFLGVTVSKVVHVVEEFKDIRFIEIQGPSEVDGGEFADYSVRIYHAFGNEEIPVQISTLSPYANVEYNRLTVYDISEEQTVALHAVYSINGVDYPAAKLVKLKPVDPALTMHDFYVTGHTQMEENDSYEFYANVIMSNGLLKKVLARWESSSSSVHASANGVMTTGTTDGPVAVFITATYSFRGITKSHTFESYLVPKQNAITSINVQGPISGVENSRLQFNCLATFQDGTNHTVMADWFCEDYHIGFDGVLEVGTTGAREREVIVVAEVNGLRAEHLVNITRDPVVLTSITIQGSENLHEGVNSTYTALANYSDGSQQPITPTWSLVDDPSWATVTSGGVVQFNDPEDGLLEIHASYLKNGVRYEQTKTLVCIAKTNIITGLIVSGPNVVDGGERIVLTATAVYKDGSFDTVTPKWSVYTEDTNAAFVAADIIGSGVVQGRDVDKNMDVIVTAKYFQEEVLYRVTVRPITVKGPDVPIASRISGPPVFYASEPASFAQRIKFEHNPDFELAVSSDWSIDVPENIARIDANGFLSMNGNVEATITVTATYECGGYTVIDSIVVTSVVRDSKYTTMIIRGPDEIEVGQSGQFSAELYAIDDTIAEGGGSFVPTDWVIVTDDFNIQVSSDGLLRVVGAVSNPSFTIKATYNDGFEIIEAVKEVAVLGSAPLFGKGPVNISDDAIFGFSGVLTTDRFALSLGAGEYGFFCIPVVYGAVTFKQIGTNVEGGWDGATWPIDGSYGSTAGPRQITRVINGVNTYWNLYRTNLSNTGNVAFIVTMH